MAEFDAVKDSGVRQDFSTGSKRDTRDGKGRFDLIPTYPLRRLAKHYENGAKKYGDRNWEKGQPLSRYLDSCMRHLVGVIEGLTDEDHASAVAWNIFAYVATCQWIEEGKLPPELDDLDRTTRKSAEDIQFAKPCFCNVESPLDRQLSYSDTNNTDKLEGPIHLEM